MKMKRGIDVSKMYAISNISFWPHMLSVPIYACIAYTRPYNKNVMRIMGTPAPRPESFHTIFGIEITL